MKVNGKEIVIEDGITLKTFLESTGYNIERIAVELNRNIVPKETYENVILNNSDSMEIVSFVGGG